MAEATTCSGAANTAKALGDIEDVAVIAKALAHPARLRIIEILLRAPGCIGHDIVDELGLAQSTTSEHLRILKAAGIITGRIERPRVCYWLNADRLQPLRTLLDRIEDHAVADAACSADVEV